ncbi:MAG: GNAT family N-acetyltransferase [Thaumarchaeota archaeon]|nr:GNAT family N-acetyltransferase [Nitrososphaerota archaeon]
MSISYTINQDAKPAEVVTLFDNSRIRRPTGDIDRIGKMIRNANLTVSARDGKKLVGILRALTDFSYCCYISDLAVDKEYQRHGIGRELIQIARETVGERVMLLLLSSPEADSFYSHIGLKKVENAWQIPRKK